MPDDEQNLPFFPDDDADVREERVPQTAAMKLRTAGRVSARIGIGLIVLAVTGVAVTAAAVIPLPKVSQNVTSTTITPVPTAQQLVCPGGLLRLASASGKGANKASALGAAAVTSGSSAGTISRTSFTGSDAGTGGTAAAPQLLSQAAATGGTASLIAGAQSESIATTEFVGQSSAACAPATGDVWLAGGATSTGRTTLVLLSNPSDVPASVNLQIFGEKGQVTAPGTNGITVAQRGQRVVSLAAFAPGLVSPVVHVTSQGGQVVASLEQDTVRGLEPGGIDFVGAQDGLARSLVIPGVAVTGTAEIAARIGTAGFDDLQTTLRLYTPSTKQGISARVSILDENGKLDGSASTVDLAPGAVTDVPLASLSDGAYTVVVTSKVLLAASVRVSTAGSAAVENHADFAWVTAAPLLATRAVASIAPASGSLHLENPTTRSETVTLHALSGAASGSADVTVTVPAGSAVNQSVLGGSTYELSGFARLYASVSGVSDGGVTSYTISPAERGSTPIRIYR